MTNTERLLLEAQESVARLDAWMQYLMTSAGIYYLNGSVPYTSESNFISLVPLANRTPYMTVNINGSDYQLQPDLLTLSPKYEALTIGDGSIGLSKLANMPTGNIYYRKSIGTGPPEVQTLATLKTDLGIVPASDIASAISDKVTVVEGYRLISTAEGLSIATISNKIDAVEGSGLISDTEKTRLALIKQSDFIITLPAAGSVAERLSGATYPTGWVLTASSTNLIITHTLGGEQLSGITIKEVDGSISRVCVPFDEAYTGITENGTSITIEGLNPTALALTLILTFA